MAPVFVATAHQISSVIMPLLVSTYFVAFWNVPVFGHVTEVTEVVCEWICDSKTMRSPTFAGDTASDVKPVAWLSTGKPET